MKRGLLFCVLMCAFMPIVLAQQFVSGKVVDKDELPLIGVNIMISGTEKGTLTDIEGNYSIEAYPEDRLVFSYVGFRPIEQTVGSRTQLDVVLSEDVEMMDEVVVVGYGTSNRADLTGAVSSLSGDDLTTTLTANIDQAIQGRIPGVQVTQNSGAPGGAASVRIRGSNSISLSSEPLYVIDGIPVQGDGDDISGFDWAGGANGQNRVNPLATINPNDIVSIDVLKDASATAIYGSRGANGVVIITTKRGESGRSKISYNSYYGLQQLPNELDMMNLPEFAEYQNQIAVDLDRVPKEQFLDPSILGPGTDWQDEVFRNAGSQSHQLSFSGGGDRTQFALSGGYFKQDGIIIGSSFERVSARLSMDNQVTDRIKVGGSFAYSQTEEEITLNDGTDGVIMQALIMPPDVPVRDIEGNFAGPSSNEQYANYNPVAAALQRDNDVNRQRILANIYGSIEIIDGLEFRSEIGFDDNNSLNKAFHPTYQWGAIFNDENRLRQRETSSFFWINKNYLTYSRDLGRDHSFTLLVGEEAQKSNYEGTVNTVRNLPSNDIQILSQGEYVGVPDAWVGASSLLSYYTRLNYNFSELLLFTFTYRADASSNFGPGNKWGYFPSGSVAFRISQLDFMKNSNTIDNLKLRLSYGASGNENIDAGSFSSLMRSVQTPFGLGFRPERIANPQLGWETTTQFNVGVDLSLFDSRVELTFDIYDKETKDMLLETTIPSYLGGNEFDDIQAPFINVGRMQNRGIEIGLNTSNIRTPKFTWNTGITFSLNRNEVLELDDPNKIYWENLYWYSEFQTASTTRVGYPVGQFWGYQMEGIFQDQDDILNHAVQISDGMIDDDHPHGRNLVDKRGGVWIGDVKFKDLNGDGIVNVDDQTFIGDPNPDFTFGFNNTFSFAGFDATIYLNGAYGGDILNYSRVEIEGMQSPFSNQAATVADRAKFQYLDPNGSITDPSNTIIANPEAVIPRPTTTDPNRNNRMSDRYIEDGSYIRIQNVKLGYTIPNHLTRKFAVERLHFYVNAQNLYTFTDYSGYDPEIGAFNQSPLLQNVDMGRYPTPRTIIFGLDLDF